MEPMQVDKLRDVVADLTDVTLVDEDTNSIPTNYANRTIQGNVAMHVTEPGGQILVPCGGQIFN